MDNKDNHMDNKKLTNTVLNLAKIVKENSEVIKLLKDELEKLKNPGAQGIEDVKDTLIIDANARLDVNNKLSKSVQKAAQVSTGPLKPDELLLHLTSNDFGKKKKAVMDVVRNFPNNIDEVKNQFSSVLGDLETRVTRRKKKNELDIQFIQRIRKFKETLEKEKEKRKKVDSKVKSESSKDQSQNVRTRNRKKTLKAEIAEKSHPGKRGMPKNQAEKTGKKRKMRYDEYDEDDDSCSSQEVEEVTVKYKRLKVNPAASSQEKIEPSIVHQSAPFRQRREPRKILSSQSSLEEDSQENFEMTKTGVKATGKSSKQPNTDENQETVEEKQLSFRAKLIPRD